LFFISLFCHAELYARRPAPARLTTFYLCVATGGALGAIAVGIVAPTVLTGTYEVIVGLVLAAVLAVFALWSMGWIVRVFWLVATSLMIALLVTRVRTHNNPGNLVHVRNFYGTLRVSQTINDDYYKATVRTLFNESSIAWVGINGDPTYLKDGSFLWQSERDGWNHFYHYSADGRLIKRVTQGKWEVRGLYGVDEANGWIYFSGTKDSHIAENIYRVKLSGGEPERLSKGDGWHSASFNSSFSFYVDNWSDINTPTQTRLVTATGAVTRVINENKVDALRQFKLGQVEFMKVKTRDGFDMEAMMIKPPDFDPNKKYPVLQYAYAGPHAPTTANRWGGNRQIWHQMLAQKGYIIWTCDNRTASGKGLESTWPVYKHMGETEIADIEGERRPQNAHGIVPFRRDRLPEGQSHGRD